MKKILSVTLLFAFLISNITTVYANSKNVYKVYNKTTNKSYQLTLGTASMVDNRYLFALYKDGKPYCVMDGKLNKKNNLIGGACTDYEALVYYIYNNGNINLDPYTFGWREIKENTFLNEARPMKVNRTNRGLIFHGDTIKQLDNIQEN